EPFSRAGWVFEVKLDGYRMRVVKQDGTARLITRNGNDYSAAFPELIRPIAALPYSSLIMDGELVILDEQGRPSFQRLQNRALHLGGYADGKLVYAGRAGSGFTGQMLKDVGDQLQALATPRPPFEGPVPAEKESHWVKPELVAEVRYKEVTGDGLLRQPVFLRFRDDKNAEECVIEGRGTRDEGRVADDPAPLPPRPPSLVPPPA